MAIYHCSIKIGSRSKGQSAVAASAYRSGTKMTDEETGIVSDYTRKSGVVHSEISICANAPAEYLNRERLWNAVHKVEKNANAQLWREIEVALPQEFDRQQQIETVREYVKNFVNAGMCADWSLHDKENGNPHAHIMLTMRSIKEDGTWAAKSKEMYVDKDGNLTNDKEKRVPDLDKKGNQKKRKDGKLMWKRQKVDYNDWNNQDKAEEWRTLWANLCNSKLAADKKIDHRSYVRQGIDLIPTVHEGYAARQIESKGGVSERCELNKEIKKNNSVIVMIAEKMQVIAEKIKAIQAEIEDEVKKGVDFNDRLNALFARRNRRATTVGMRGTGNGNRTVETGNCPQDDTDRRIKDTNRRIAELKQQRIADEARREQERKRELEEQARREREREERSYRSSWER